MSRIAITDVDLYRNGAVPGHVGHVSQALSDPLPSVRRAFTYRFFQHQTLFHLKYGVGDFSYRKG